MIARIRYFAWLLSILAAWNLAAAEDKPQTNERLKELLKRFPNADANKDGVLTFQEAQAYKEKALTRRGTERAAPEQKPTFAEVSYGPAERNVLDFYQAKSEKPTPLIIYIHGGGFVGG